MKVSIEEIKKSPDNKLEIDFYDSIEDLNHKDRVSAALVAFSSGYSIIVNGKIKAKMLLECDRCLGEYVYEVDADINEEFVTGEVVPADQKEYELGAGDFVEELGDEKEIDIKDLVYQSIILQLPYKNLCKPDCAGSDELQNLNNKNEEYIDERLEVFKTFSENEFSETKKEGIKV